MAPQTKKISQTKLAALVRTVEKTERAYRKVADDVDALDFVLMDLHDARLGLRELSDRKLRATWIKKMNALYSEMQTAARKLMTEHNQRYAAYEDALVNLPDETDADYSALERGKKTRGPRRGMRGGRH